MIEARPTPAVAPLAPQAEVLARITRGASGRDPGATPGAGVPFESEIARGARRGPFAPDLGENEGSRAHAAPAAPDFFGSSFDAFAAGGNPVAFLAQQIAQDMVAESVAPEQMAAAAAGCYRAVPESRVTYDGPQVALDITV